MNKSSPADFPPEKIISILKSSRLLSQFDEIQLTRLLAFSTVERFKKGARIIEEKQRNKNIYILLKGSVAVYVGDELILKLRRKGDMIGEMSVITRSLTTASIVAASSVVLFSIPSRKIYDSDHKDLQAHWFKLFSDILVEKLSMTNEKVIGFHAASASLDDKTRELVHKTMILQSIMGSMTDGVVVTDSSGRVLQVNDAFNRMIGGIKIPDSIDLWPESIGIFEQDQKTRLVPERLPMVKVQSKGSVDSQEVYIKNDALMTGVWLQATGSPLKSDDGASLDGCVVVFRNITRKKLEEKNLIKAKENAEAAARAKSDFLSIMSHELRTPLNGILGMTNLLGNSSLSKEQAQWLDNIESSGRSLLGKIRNILYFNTLESGDVQVKKENLRLEDIIRESTGPYELSAKEKSITIRLDLCPGSGWLLAGDREKIGTVLEHLVDNAVKYTEKGSVGIQTAVKEENDELVKFVIRITDTGIGISPKEMHTLFQPFSQADTSLSRRFEGTGLGLAIAKRAVEMMGGDLTVQSRSAKGSTFEFTLILTKPDDPATRHLENGGVNVQALINKKYALRNPLSILVAEDNKVNQLLIKKVLKNLGYQVQIAENGLEAFEACRTARFDLVLMDIQMPEMDGLTAARKIIEDPDQEQPPYIVALTANTAEGIREDCFAAGMKDYMTKPLDVVILVEVLEKLLGKT